MIKKLSPQFEKQNRLKSMMPYICTEQQQAMGLKAVEKITNGQLKGKAALEFYFWAKINYFCTPNKHLLRTKIQKQFKLKDPYCSQLASYIAQDTQDVLRMYKVPIDA